MNHGRPVGIMREYCRDNDSWNINDKKNKIPTPGWMFSIKEITEMDLAYGKKFNFDGSIEEGDMGTWLVNGFRWELKDDKSHDKFKVTDS
jgi:hypothetical protein